LRFGPTEVTEMSLGYGWQPLADALVDLVWYACLYLTGGAVAIGACMYGGHEAYRAWQDWERDSLRRRQERRIERETARGLVQLEEFLQDQTRSTMEESKLPKTTAEGKIHRRQAPHRDP